jgi:1-acyl-sn-glycerol-3-phosphate acyltransferase
VVQRYFPEGCQFIPPYRSTLWCRIFRWILPYQVRRHMGISRWQFRGLDLLRESLGQNAGILLTPNHCRWSDPAIMGQLGGELGRFFYFVASYHLFKQSRLLGWYLNRTGAFSVNREGADREAIRASVRILAEAERPLVLFPEGTWFRQNDRLGPLQEGVALIARQAARSAGRPIRVHPVGIKYWLLADTRPLLRRQLAHHERHLGWHPQEDLELVPRIEKLGNALLSVKEVDFLGLAQHGALDDRIRGLTETRVAELEKYYFTKSYEGWILERIRRVRQHLVGRLPLTVADVEEHRRTEEALADLLFCENLSAHSMAYLHERPSLERLTETVQRIEETMTDDIKELVVPLGAVVEVGPALDVRDFDKAKGAARAAGDPFMRHLATAIQGLLNKLLTQGAPPEWGCPVPVEPIAPAGEVRSAS